jgi:phage gpG-like protein
MSLSINLTGILLRLGRLSNNPLTPWLTKVIVTERKKVEARIKKTKRTPEDTEWAPWRPRTEAYRSAKGNTNRGLLYDEGLLLASIVSRSSQNSASLGTVAPYAPFLQDGTEEMVARPFMGWDDVSLAQYELDAIATLERAAR